MLAHIIEIRQVASDVPLMGASVICANYFEKSFSFHRTFLLFRYGFIRKVVSLQAK